MSSSNTTGSEKPTEPPVFVNGEDVLHEMQRIVGRKWHPILVYRLLQDGPMGFSRLKSRIDGISSKMLSETLTDLNEAGLVNRTQLSEQPVRVEYTLTERGRSLETVITEMVMWGYKYGDDEDRDNPKGRSKTTGRTGQ